MKKYFAVLGSLLVITIAGLALWTVQAQPVAPDKPHCVVRVYDAALQRDGELQQCFDTAAAAVEFATDGRISLPENASGEDVSRAIRQSQQNSLSDNIQTNQISPQSTNHVVSIQWDLDNQRGNAVYFTSQSLCSQTMNGHILSLDYGLSHPGWENEVGSAEAFAGCQSVELWDFTNMTGASITCSPYCSFLGVMYDNAESARTWK